MDQIKEKIEEIVNKVKNDPDFMKRFQENPVKVAEEITGMDLPDDQINSIIDGVKAKLTVDQGTDLLGKITGLFQK